MRHGGVNGKPVEVRQERDGYYVVRLALDASVIPGGEPTDFIDCYEGPIALADFAGDRAPAGRFRAYRVRIDDAIDAGFAGGGLRRP